MSRRADAVRSMLSPTMLETLRAIGAAGTSDVGLRNTRLALLRRRMVEIAAPGYAYTGTDRRASYRRAALRLTPKGAAVVAAMVEP